MLVFHFAHTEHTCVGFRAHLHWDFLARDWWLRLEKFGLPIGRLSKLTNRQQEFSSFSHQSRAKKSLCKLTFSHCWGQNDRRKLYPQPSVTIWFSSYSGTVECPQASCVWHLSACVLSQSDTSPEFFIDNIVV